MRVLITGIDGYLGFPLALSLGAKGHEVAGIDNGLRRKLVSNGSFECVNYTPSKCQNSQSAIPIPSMIKRTKIYQELFGKTLRFQPLDLSDPVQNFSKSIASITVFSEIREFQPDAIIYLGEIPSAPYSMIGPEEAFYTQRNNVLGTLNTLYAMQEVCPDAHLIKLGSMGEYGTPTCPIPEGHFPEGSAWDRKKPDGTFWAEDISGMTFPKQAGSWYHLSKVHDSNNIEFACRNWGLRSTDIMQGVVYGTRTDEMYLKFYEKNTSRGEIKTTGEVNTKSRTRFDFDECFGTVINRFCAQAVAGLPLTVYGEGKQKRGFLPLRDSIQCMNLALENPPEKGEYRVFNQFEEVYSILELAEMVAKVYYVEFNPPEKMESSVIHLENPRNEAAEHYYNPVHQKLFDLGYKPTNDLKGQIQEMIEDLIPHRQRILDCKDVLIPKIGWDGKIKERKEL